MLAITPHGVFIFMSPLKRQDSNIQNFHVFNYIPYHEDIWVVTSTRVLYVETGRMFGLLHAAASLSPGIEPPVCLITMFKEEIFTYSGTRNPFIELLSHAVIK